MGSKILEFTVKEASGGVVFVEVDDPQETGNRPVSRNVAEKARQTLEDALTEVMPGVNALIGKMQDLVSKPDELGLEFGIKFTAEAGALIAKTGVEGNIKVSLKWAKSK